jgi:HipA-like protein
MKNLFKKLLKPESLGTTFTPTDAVMRFQLMYQNLLIGELLLQNGKWRFKYSDAFKAQSILKPLVEFPDIHKLYISEELSPFFLERIPGLGQPKVQEILSKENIDEQNTAALLKRFGRVSITNPFKLEAS